MKSQSLFTQLSQGTSKHVCGGFPFDIQYSWISRRDQSQSLNKSLQQTELPTAEGEDPLKDK